MTLILDDPFGSGSFSSSSLTSTSRSIALPVPPIPASHVYLGSKEPVFKSVTSDGKGLHFASVLFKAPGAGLAAFELDA